MLPAQTGILVVDDHQDIRDPLAAYLQRFGFDVATAYDGKDMRERLAQRRFDLILLDVMLPGENGLSLCRHVVEHLHIPVILLTAVTEQADRVAGLEVGADDYVVKPFDPRELVARIRSVLRRVQRQDDAAPQEPLNERSEPRFLFDGWVLDTRRRELHSPQETLIALSATEFHLLRVLLEHPNRVLSRDQLLDLTQRTELVMFDRSIDSQISRLRKKLEADPRRPGLLKTIRGGGYMLTAKVVVSRA